MPKAGSRAKPRRSRHPAGAQHAFVGGWSQRRGDFVSLLLGVRQGRRRKLTYIGEVKTDPDGLEMTLLEPRLRESEVEASPFVEGPPEHPNRRNHWINPDLVAEIEFDGWTRDGTVGKAALKAVTDRPAFRHANWIAPPR
jgi:bifunctional non-homologous end joining protein LigD